MIQRVNFTGGEASVDRVFPAGSVMPVPLAFKSNLRVPSLSDAGHGDGECASRVSRDRRDRAGRCAGGGQLEVIHAHVLHQFAERDLVDDTR